MLDGTATINCCILLTNYLLDTCILILHGAGSAAHENVIQKKMVGVSLPPLLLGGFCSHFWTLSQSQPVSLRVAGILFQVSTTRWEKKFLLVSSLYAIYSLPNTWNSYDIIRYYANRTTFSIALKELLHTTPTNAAESD
jgi:hypothetical protein